MTSENGASAPERIDRLLELSAMFVLSASAVGLVATLGGRFRAWPVWGASAALTLGWAVLTRRRPARLGGGTPRWAHLAVLVVVALCLRLPAFNWVLGGQDQGLYVNIARHIVRTGGIEVFDGPLEKLQGTPAAATRYVAENGGPGGYVPGVYRMTGTSTDPTLEFQFYHLFPVWLALFGGVLGGAHAVYALTLFALLSVLFFYRITVLLSGSPRIALVAGLALAVNPLHAFFSKFPVTELSTLVFSEIGFCFLAAYVCTGASRRRLSWLALSALAFGALFFTRISGFEYMPFVAAIGIATLACDGDRQRRVWVNGWAMCVVALYAVSVLYGLRYSSHYAHDIYQNSFARIFGERWPWGIAAVVGLLLAVWLAVGVLARPGPESKARRWIVFSTAWVGPLVLVALLLGAWKVYRLGWTDHYATDPWIGVLWGFSGRGMAAIGASSVVQLVFYLGPLLPLAFLVLGLGRRAAPTFEFLRIFVAGFFVYALVLQWFLPYGPYYARYLLSELLPYLLLFVMLAWAELPKGRGRALLSGAIGLSLVYGLAGSLVQLGKVELGGVEDAIARFVAPVEPHDLILLELLGNGTPNTSELKTALVYSLDRTVDTVTPESLADPSYLAALSKGYARTWVLSRDGHAPPGFELADSTRLEVKAFDHRAYLPARFHVHGAYRLYLYRRESGPVQARSGE